VGAVAEATVSSSATGEVATVSSADAWPGDRELAGQRGAQRHAVLRMGVDRHGPPERLGDEPRDERDA
jgi:hypothetical protein